MLNNVKKWKRCVVASFYLDLAQLPGELFNPKDNWKKLFQEILLFFPFGMGIYYTVNISAVKITVFRCVPFPAVLSLYFLHCTTAPITVEKCKH